MSVTRAFYDSVNEGNLLRTRIIMKDSLIMDLTFNDYSIMEKEAKTKFSNELYEKYDGIKFIEDKLQWNKDYMNTLQVELIDNFCKERVEHLKKVIIHLNSNQSGNTKTFAKHKSYKEQKTENNHRLKKCIITSAAGATIGGIGSYIIGVSVIGGVVVGSIIGATAGYIISDGE